MEHAIPLPEMSHRWLDKARSRLLVEPSDMLVFEHSGAVHADLIPDMLDLVEAHSYASGDPIVLRKRLIHVLVESVDNMRRHALGILADASFALLVRNKDGYRFTTGNAVPHATAMLLAKRVEILNAMEGEDLKEHYMKLLTNDSRSTNGGAGLGLLTLARKSMRPILTTSDTLGPFTSYFSFELQVCGDADYPAPPAA
ncbi:MAG: hypothetical protein IPL81_15965 [Flavobacteriales bacterium]|jgi:hypothetical protein|nr:hypothetical protein [Flavobacteriales bacterium]